MSVADRSDVVAASGQSAITGLSPSGDRSSPPAFQFLNSFQFLPDTIVSQHLEAAQTMNATTSETSTEPRRLVVMTEGYSDPVSAKTACSVIRYRPEEVVAVFDREQAGRTTQDLFGVGGGIPVIGDLSEASEANGLLIGIAPSGGKVPNGWRPILLEAIQRGMDIISGLHQFLNLDPELSAAAKQHGVTLHDVRSNAESDCSTRIGLRPDCLRVHAVGQDCCVGKMVSMLEIDKALKKKGHDSYFVATGQTGIMVSGDGCPVDCVVSDFIAGAVEKLVLKNQHHEILLFEGQGSLAHPKYSAVTLGLLHGCLPHGLIMCYEAGREWVHGMEEQRSPLFPLAQLKTIYETMSNLWQPCRFVGVAMNSRRLSDDEANDEQKRVEDELQLPVVDVFRHGPDRLAQAIIDLKTELFP